MWSKRQFVLLIALVSIGTGCRPRGTDMNGAAVEVDQAPFGVQTLDGPVGVQVPADVSQTPPDSLPLASPEETNRDLGTASEAHWGSSEALYSWKKIWVSVFPAMTKSSKESRRHYPQTATFLSYKLENAGGLKLFSAKTGGLLREGRKVEVKLGEHSIIADGQRLEWEDVFVLPSGEHSTKACYNHESACHEFRGSFLAEGRHLTNGSLVLHVVNILDLEEYLRGVVPSEVSSKYPIEALKAQALAARTFGLFTMVWGRSCPKTSPKCNRNFHVRHYDLDATTNDQMYLGTKFEKPSTDEAVRQTRGQVILFNGMVINAQFHANSGGRTCSAADCKGGSAKIYPYLQSVADAEGVRNKNMEGAYQDKTFFSASLLSVAKSIHKDLRGKKLVSVDVVSRNQSGRPSGVRVTSDQGSCLLTGESLASFSRSLGFPNHFYEAFQVKSDKVSVRFYGNGHGRGMSQVGAKLFAQQGLSSIDIIKHFYTGVEVVTLKGL